MNNSNKRETFAFEAWYSQKAEAFICRYFHMKFGAYPRVFNVSSSMLGRILGIDFVAQCGHKMAYTIEVKGRSSHYPDLILEYATVNSDNVVRRGSFLTSKADYLFYLIFLPDKVIGIVATFAYLHSVLDSKLDQYPSGSSYDGTSWFRKIPFSELPQAERVEFLNNQLEPS
jgi:hypothetical protein